MSFSNFINQVITEQNETRAERLVRLYPATEDSTKAGEAVLLHECLWNQYSVESAEYRYDKWLSEIARWGREHATEKLAAADIVKSIYAAIVATAAEGKMFVGIQNYDGMPEWHDTTKTDSLSDFKPITYWPDRLARWEREQAAEARRKEEQIKKWHEGANAYFSDFLDAINSWEYRKLNTVRYWTDEDNLEWKEVSVKKLRAAVEAGGKARENAFKWFVTHDMVDGKFASMRALLVPEDKVLELCDYRIPDDYEF